MKKLVMVFLVSSLSLNALAIEGSDAQFDEGQSVFQRTEIQGDPDGDVLVSTGSLIVDKKNGNSLSLRCVEADTQARGCSKAAVYLEDSEGIRPITKDLDKEELAGVSEKIRQAVISHAKLPKAMWNVPFFAVNNWMCKVFSIGNESEGQPRTTCRLVSGAATVVVATAAVALWVAPVGSALSVTTAAGEMSVMGGVLAFGSLPITVVGVPLAASMVLDIAKAPIYPVIAIRNFFVKLRNNKLKKQQAQAQDAVQSLSRGGTLKIKHNAFEALAESIRAF